jgi:hypothetical protein
MGTNHGTPVEGERTVSHIGSFTGHWTYCGADWTEGFTDVMSVNKDKPKDYCPICFFKLVGSQEEFFRVSNEATGQYLADVQARVAKASPGPWQKLNEGCIHQAGNWRHEGHVPPKAIICVALGWNPIGNPEPQLQIDDGDADFIMNARTDVPVLQSMAEAARDAAVSFRQAAKCPLNSELWQHWMSQGEKAFSRFQSPGKDGDMK